MARSELETTSFDHEELKQSLISFLQSTNEFGDFNYEGSAINTMVDLLVRNSTYTAYLANMLANESFIESAQIRANVVSHAEKLSYVPKTNTAARLQCTVEVTPTSTPTETSIVMDAGTVFLANVGGQTYSFVSTEAYLLTYSTSRGTFRATGVDLYQGQLITNRFIHFFGQTITIPNSSCDSSTITVLSREIVSGETGRLYNEASSLDSLDSDSPIYFRGEDHQQRTTINFGRNILGSEPPDGSTIEITYVSTEEDHANGVKSLIPATTIDGYSNISIDITIPSYGGSERDNIERIRYLAPKVYQAQDRALTASDYIPILRKQFPFISSAISWGGEDNEPQQFGSVFISIISNEGDLITNAVKQQMQTYVKSRNVGSITPIIVDPERFGIDLEVAFAFDNRITSKTYNELVADIISVSNAYGETLNDFDQFFNYSTLLRDIRAIRGITSVVLYKKIFKDIDVLSFENPVYEANFKNPIIPGSVLAEGFKVSSNGINHKIFDRNGTIYVSYSVSGEVTERSIGTVDYETGDVEFTVNILQDTTEFRLYIETEWSNFYVAQNRVVYLNDITTRLLEGIEGVV